MTEQTGKEKEKEKDSKEKVLERDLSMLREFDEGESPDLLVLYFHLQDHQYDCFNASEYHEQLRLYYQHDVSVVLTTPRRMNDHEYFLVCLQNSTAAKNVLCQLAFQCKRQFCGVSMLVKKRCFVCNQPTKMMCKGCHCACYCSRECQSRGWDFHKKVCKKIKNSNVVHEEECVEIEI